MWLAFGIHGARFEIEVNHQFTRLHQTIHKDALCSRTGAEDLPQLVCRVTEDTHLSRATGHRPKDLMDFPD